MKGVLKTFTWTISNDYLEILELQSPQALSVQAVSDSVVWCVFTFTLNSGLMEGEGDINF